MNIVYGGIAFGVATLVFLCGMMIGREQGRDHGYQQCLSENADAIHSRPAEALEVDPSRVITTGPERPEFWR